MMGWAKRHPGRITCRNLQKMEDAVQGEGRKWGRRDAPPSAESFYLRHLKPDCPNHAVRNLREMKTLCTVLDHIALGRSGAAADVLTQRLKAVEMATREGNWNRSGFLELVEEDNASLVSTDEQMLVRKEVEARDKRFVPSSSDKNFSNFVPGKPHQGKGQAPWQPKGWGPPKAYQKGGKNAKNDKGKAYGPAAK
jgi:hypothetical protein